MTKSNGAPTQGHGLDGFYAALRRPGIMRQSDGRWFAGVATGLARWLGVDPLVVRAGFILFSIFFGMGLALYLVLWLLMPDERGEVHVERALKHGEGHSIFLLVVTVISVLGGGPWWGGDFQGFRFFGFALLLAGAWWFLTRTDTGRDLLAQAPWRNRGAGTTDGSASTDPASAPQPGATATGGGTVPAGPAPHPAYASTGNAAANAGAALATPRPPAPTPVRYRTPSIGFAGGLLVLGLAIVTGVVVSTAADASGWTGNNVAVGIASAVGMLGLGVVVAGIAGRRSGGLPFFAVVGMVVAAATTAAPHGLSQPWNIGERTFTVTSMTPARDYELGVGEMKIDLSKANYQATQGTDTVTATLGLGELNIVVPEGANVVVNAKARAGDIVATGPEVSGDGMRERGPDQLDYEGADWTKRVTFGSTTGTPDIVVNAEVGLASIGITTEGAR
ncbi:PspC domain-containing protein [Terrabacter sp. MAHUQ-38]|uniref:PspC domain-containing protein n=1 Tax=unclassified Terrabacter TaxID=2630222 RepID=UPI00165D55D1|nr:PspC domain-containing protein [Terrabacter sp. MAHUQ-38]MBC9822056.1 PspC domain-containing protein [Terrabacter sp. MAHUQ-38]